MRCSSQAVDCTGAGLGWAEGAGALVVQCRQSFLSLSGGVQCPVTRRRLTSSRLARPGSRVFCSRIFLVPSEWYFGAGT